MANIEKIPGKTGDTYRITVAGGFDCNGKRIRHQEELNYGKHPKSDW